MEVTAPGAGGINIFHGHCFIEGAWFSALRSAFQRSAGWLFGYFLNRKIILNNQWYKTDLFVTIFANKFRAALLLHVNGEKRISEDED